MWRSDLECAGLTALLNARVRTRNDSDGIKSETRLLIRSLPLPVLTQAKKRRPAAALKNGRLGREFTRKMRVPHLNSLLTL